MLIVVTINTLTWRQHVSNSWLFGVILALRIQRVQRQNAEIPTLLLSINIFITSFFVQEKEKINFSPNFFATFWLIIPFYFCPLLFGTLKVDEGNNVFTLIFSFYYLKSFQMQHCDTVEVWLWCVHHRVEHYQVTNEEWSLLVVRVTSGVIIMICWAVK